MDITELLKFAKDQNASDLHISSGEPPMVRKDGDLQKLDTLPLGKEDVHTILYDILNDRQRKIFEEVQELDFAISFGETSRYRVNAFVQNRGEAIVFRTIPFIIPSLADLGLPNILADIARKNKGLVLVTGPTGSGKSTTLASMLEFVNSEDKVHIITVEDPIEFEYEPKKALINQRELGVHTKSFANALRSALREDPDVILVGEMRDLETISLAITAAETGHLVLSTLHTSSAPKTIDRIIDVFPAEQQSQIRTMFSESILAVISQSLIKRKDGKGRVVALEIMIATHAIRNLIREGKVAQIHSSIQTGRQHGMQTMDDALKELYEKESVSLDSIKNLLSNPNIIKA
ncbi:MAG: type IV pilus twitching motility protein PilT [Candidatus Scalinduaceae bacterium]